MIWRIFLVVIAAVAIGLAGCSKKEEPAEPVKTADELKAEADKEITQENLASELDKMEAEIEADAAAEP